MLLQMEATHKEGARLVAALDAALSAKEQLEDAIAVQTAAAEDAARCDTDTQMRSYDIFIYSEPVSVALFCWI
jgi:hypothetical protein